MHPFPPRAGLVDLTLQGECFALQAFAASRARFTIASGSGMDTLSTALHTPTAHVDHLDVSHLWGKRDIVLMKHVFDERGRRVPVNDVIDGGHIFDEARRLPPGYQMRDNTLAELCLGAKIMFDFTPECTQWREQVLVTVDNPPNKYTLPLDEMTTVRVVDFPELAPVL